jgi:hypothetical protein
MAKATDRLFKALDDVRKASGDKAKVEAAVKEAEAAAEAVEKEAEKSEQALQESKKASAEKPQAASPEEDAASTGNLAPIEDFDYDMERRMQAPYSAGERAALDDPSYRGGNETDWLNPAEPYKSPIELALDKPKLHLMRARRV